MPMKNPPHVGRVIQNGIFEPLGLSISKAAEVLGVRRATLSDLINGKAALTAEMALRIHKAFGPDVGHLPADASGLRRRTDHQACADDQGQTLRGQGCVIGLCEQHYGALALR